MGSGWSQDGSDGSEDEGGNDGDAVYLIPDHDELRQRSHILLDDHKCDIVVSIQIL